MQTLFERVASMAAGYARIGCWKCRSGFSRDKLGDRIRRLYCVIIPAWFKQIFSTIADYPLPLRSLTNMRLVLTAMLLLFACFAAADGGPSVGIEHSISDQGLHGWRLRQGALEIEIVQRLPDQTRGFFLARGFDSDTADRIADNCVMQTIVRNLSGDKPLDVDLTGWRRTDSGVSGALKLKSDWEREWQNAEVSKSAHIAFFWSLFPTEQHFEPGDYNWGMISYGLPPGSVFDLDLSWREADEPQKALIENITCAKDH